MNVEGALLDGCGGNSTGREWRKLYWISVEGTLLDESGGNSTGLVWRELY
jgi:hypothetical protein